MVVDRVEYNYEEMRINFLNDVLYAKHRTSKEPLFTDSMRNIIETKVNSTFFRSYMIRHFASLLADDVNYVIPAEPDSTYPLPEILVQAIEVNRGFAKCDIITPSIYDMRMFRSDRIGVMPVVVARFSTVEDDKHPLKITGLDLGFASYMPSRYVGAQYAIEGHSVISKNKGLAVATMHQDDRLAVYNDPGDKAYLVKNIL